MDKFSKRRASIRDLQRQLAIKNSKKTPKELGMHERFEDDPRALKENDVGKVRRNPTHVNSLSAIDDMS